MDKPLRQRLQRMIGVEEEGRITPKELADYVARCAIEPGFFDHLDLFSPEVIAYLRDRALHAAPHPEDSLAFSRVLVRGKFDYEAHERETREVTTGRLDDYASTSIQTCHFLNSNQSG